MGMKDKQKTHKSKKAAQPNLEIVEKDKMLGSAEMRKRKRVKESDADSRKVVQVSVEDNSAKPAKDKKKTKLTKKRKVKNAKNYVALESENDHPKTETDDDFNEINDDGVADQSPFETQEEIEIGEVLTEAGKSKKAKKKKKKDRNPLELVKSLEKEVEAGRESSSRGISSVSKKALKKKKRDLDSSKSTKTMETEVEADQADVYLISYGDEDSSKGMKNKMLGSAEMRKRKRAKESDADSRKVVQVSVEVDNSAKPAKDKKKTKLTKKRKIKNEKNYVAVESENDHPNTETDDDFNEINDDGVADPSPFETQEEIEIGEVLSEAGKSKKAKKKKKKDRNPLEFVKSLEKEVEAGRESSSRGISSVSKKALKKKKRDLDSSKSTKTMETEVEADQADVYLISYGDEDSSKGMKKWVTEYHQSRPGLKELQQRIDQFMVEHDEKLEQEKKEKEARAAEGGWTVVVHHKGRKKTTDTESGITVGSVAQAALEDKVAKKKRTEVVGLDFYRFQRKEAQRNEIMMLQSKFEQDKKRIQQLRAARKFRPY